MRVMGFCVRFIISLEWTVKGVLRGGSVEGDIYQDKDGVPLCGTEGGIVVGCHGVGSSVMSLLSLVVVKGMCRYQSRVFVG